MHAFVQRLRCGDHLIVRAGPDTKQYGDEYERSCLGEIDGQTVTLMAFSDPNGIPPTFFKAFCTALFDDGFRSVQLDRLTANPRRLVFTNGENGEIKMAVKKEMIPHISEIFKADGTLNVPVAAFGLAHAMGQDAAGHISISRGSASQVDNPDGSVDVTIKFRRNHH